MYKNRFLILFNIVMMTFMANLDGSIVNVTLPIMAKNLSVTAEVVSWVVTVYLITIAATILIFGRLGDIKGKTKIFEMGIVLFTFGSFLCGIADSIYFLITARVIQGIGAGCTMATNQGIITQTFPDNERGRALGISGSFVALGALVGPPLGGVIASFLSWKYIFLINVPIGLFTFIMGIKILPKDIINSPGKFDIRGAFLFIISIISLFGSLIIGQDIGYSNIIIILGFIVSIIAIMVFIFIEKKRQDPLLQFKIFNNHLFTISIFCGFTSFVAISCSTIVQPFYLQDVMKMSPYITGLIMMAYPITLLIVAPISGYISDKIGSEILTFIGLMLTSLGLFLMATLTQYSQIWHLIIFIIAMSLGNGLFQSPNNSLVMSTVPKNILGVAGSINALVRNLGMVVGVALSTILLYSQMSKQLGYQVSSYISGKDDEFIYGMRFVYITAGIICLIGAVLTFWRLYRKHNLDRNAYGKI